jgi:uncharacterized protein
MVDRPRRLSSALAATLPLALLAAPVPRADVVAVSISAIQGRGALSPLQDQTVATSGVVTQVHSHGFFLQDPRGDGDEATSDGIFVFTRAAPIGVAVGQRVQLSGTVAEFSTAGSSVTQLSRPSGLTVTGTGDTLAPTTVTLPVAGDLERFEGMLIKLTGPLVVQQNYFYARYGQLTLGYGGRLQTPTNRYRPGAQAQALAQFNALSSVLLDDGSSAQNPNPTPFIGTDGAPRAGDSFGDITGVIDYGPASSVAAGPGDYKIHPTVTPTLSLTHPRPAAPAPVGGNVKVGSFNVLNYFTTFTDGTTASGQTGQGCSLGTTVAAAHCRGANHLAEFRRQRDKIVAAVAVMNADVLGLMEIQNNGNVAAQNLVDALNARVGAGTYATIALPAAGTGTDAIRMAMIYRPDRLSVMGAPVSDTDPVHHRPPLAQTFQLTNGERFTLVVNHFKSKGSCPAAGDAGAAGNTDTGDGQGCWNALRTQQAQRLRTFVAQRQAAAGSNDVLVIGDLNAYAQEDPIDDLTRHGFVDQIGRYNRFGYSYVFDGLAGRLDHALTTPSLSAKVTGAVHWHINADESPAQDYHLAFKQPACAACAPDPYTASPYRSSDHDPVVVGLDLRQAGAAVPGQGARRPVRPPTSSTSTPP